MSDGGDDSPPVCAVVMQNYGIPRIMLHWQEGVLSLPWANVQPEDYRLGEECDPNKLAFLRAIRPFGLSTGMKYIHHVADVAGFQDTATAVRIYTANICQPMHPKAVVRWLRGERASKGMDCRWQFNLYGDVGPLAELIIAQYGKRLAEISYENA